MATLQAQIADPGFYEQASQITTQVLARLDDLQTELDRLIERWAELEA